MQVYFDELFIINENTKKAKTQKFKKGINMIVSSDENGDGNYAGKSTLLKSIFHCLGADALFDNSQGWESDCKYVYILKFEIDNKKYTILRHDNNFFVYDDNKLIFRCNERIKLSEFYLELFNFGVLLKETQKGKMYTLAQPFSLFCLNFIDQKKYVGCGFGSFNNISQYSDIYSDLIHSHMGIDCKELVTISNRITDMSSELEKMKETRNTYKKILQTLNEEYVIPFDTIKSITEQIDIHRDEYEQIITKFNKSKEVLYNLNNQKSLLIGEINRINTIIKKGNSDIKKIINNHECPMCNNKIENYATIFFKKTNISDDLDYQLLSFEEEITNIDKKIDKEIEKYKLLEIDLEKFEKVIAFDDLSTQNIVEKIGMKKYKSKISNEYKTSIQKCFELEEKIAEDKKLQKNGLNKIDECNTAYNQKMNELISKYNITLLNNGCYKLDKKITCSDNYILSVLWLCTLNYVKHSKNINGLFMPLVFDNPTDRDFDLKNTNTILNMIFDSVDVNKQILVSKLSFDSNKYPDRDINVIKLSNPVYSLLNENDYEYCNNVFSSLCRIVSD